MNTKKKETPEEQLAKMESILAGHTRRRRVLGLQLKRAQARLAGATRDVLKRRFTYDIEKIQEPLDEVIGKQQWAKRMVASIKEAIDLASLTGQRGELIHRPFAALKNIKL